MIKILVMGLPNSGKSRLSQNLFLELSKLAKVTCFNADKVRLEANDWDFTKEGRIRQAKRVIAQSNQVVSDYVIFDLVAPLPEMREIIDPDWIVWMDTGRKNPYKDTGEIFQDPKIYDFHVTEFLPSVKEIAQKITNNQRQPVFDWKKPTVQLMGRFQPWHDGHEALFLRALQKTGQVLIMVRDTFGQNAENPFSFCEVKKQIHRALDYRFQGSFQVLRVPNIVNITFGRDVGYKIEQEHLPEHIESISATKIRKQLKLGEST